MSKIAKLDDEGNPILDTAVEVVTITVDGHDVEVPQSTAAILEKAEHDLKSRNERALREGRENISALLTEDTTWFNTHPTELWSMYAPKVTGGKGFTGDPTMLTAKPEPVSPVIPTALIDDSRVKALEAENAQIKATLAQIQGNLGQNDEMKVVEIKDAALRRYSEANPKTVQKELQAFYFTTGRHPNATEINDIVRENHEFVATKVDAARTAASTPAANLPPVVGSGPPPSLSKTKTPRLDDIDAWKGLAHADNVSPG